MTARCAGAAFEVVPLPIQVGVRRYQDSHADDGLAMLGAPMIFAVFLVLWSPQPPQSATSCRRGTFDARARRAT